MVDFIHAVISALIGLGILIIIHELGHFLLAKKTGVGVLTFSIGFGPRLLGRKIGETEYLLSAFPLGGYVKMVGEDPEEEVQAGEIQRSFSHQRLAKRTAIVAAGPGFNLLLAMVIFMVLSIVYGTPTLTTRVGNVEPNSPAARAGIQSGDQILAINGQAVGTWEELSSRIRGSQGKALTLRFQREQQEMEIAVQPVKRDRRSDDKTEAWIIGITSEVAMERSNPLVAAGKAIYDTGKYSLLILVGLYKMVTGEIPAEIGGPILIAQMASQQARQGLASFFFFVAILSVNLGVLNLLPIPVLDGGHLLFFLMEWVIGKPVKVKHRERAQQVGVFILVLIMIYAFYRDIARLFEG